ncbi:MAG: PAS domain S-box protein [Deferribacteres bacterium]|nr:PAS domain S-box protein [candidate division KSB1 bacterium]MCB9500792.1 PAS domain S-box protein [Deferribacteres bacterium]
MIRILLVEDDPDIANLTQIQLRKSGEQFSLVHAMDPNEALRLVKQQTFEIVLLDYNLPEMTGLDWLESVRSIIKDTPILLITGAGNEKVAVAAMKQGVYDYIIKDGDYLKKLPFIIRSSCEKADLERQLRQSRQRYAKLFHVSHDAVLILDSETHKILEANGRATRVFGGEQSQIVGKSLFDFCDIDECEKLQFAFLRVKDNLYEEIEYLVLRDVNGNTHEAEVSLNVIDADNVNIVQCILRDITEKRHLQQQILKSKGRLQAMFDSVHDLISVQDKDYSIVMVNNRFADWCGNTPEKLIGQKCFSAYFKREKPCEDCPLEETFRHRRENFIETEYDEEILHIWANPMPGLTNNDEYAIEHIRIVTEQKRLEEQLIQSEKLATIGILSSGIAHELRNPLNIIEAARYYLSEIVPEEEEDIQKKLAIIRVNVQRSSKIINNLLEFSRKNNLEREETDLNYVLESTLGLIEKELRHREILINKNLSAPVISQVNSEGIRHAFLNLIMNAMQAMPEGGELQIRTFIDAIDKHIHVEFEDSGIGIPAENLKHIFTPFYTTKPIGEGTGLGLHIANSIVTHHKGKITVESQIQKGTKFTVILPLMDHVN